MARIDAQADSFPRAGLDTRVCLWHTLRMATVSQFPPVTNDPISPDDDLRLQKIADAINTLLSPFPPQEQDRILRKITKNLCRLPTPKAREVLGVIVRLFPQNESWTVEA